MRLRRETGAHAARRPGGQVDLAEQQHEDQAHRDDRDVRALAGQVADVVAAQEPAADLGEDHRQDDESEDRGQRARIAGAQPVEVAGDGVADAAALDVEVEVAGRAVGGAPSPA